MKKTLWLYGILVFAGGLIGGAVSGEICRLPSAAAAPVAPTSTPAAPQRLVAASEFVLLDPVGKARARISVSKDDQVSFVMYDRNNHLRARIAVDSIGTPSVRLYDLADKLRLALEVASDGIPTVRLLDSHSRPRALLGVDGDGEPGLNFYEADGKLMRELP